MAEEKPQAGLVPMVSALGSIVAPVIAALTGTIYLAGWTQRETILGRFGLTSNHFSESLRSTLARGYFPFLSIALVGGLAAGLVWLFTLRKGVSSDWSGNSPLARSARALDTFYKWNVYIFFALAILLMGRVGGAFSGDSLADNAAQRIAANCREGCFVYLAPGSRIVGLLLAEDSQQMAILTRGGVVLLKSAEVRVILPYRPRRAPPPR